MGQLLHGCFRAEFFWIRFGAFAVPMCACTKRVGVGEDCVCPRWRADLCLVFSRTLQFAADHHRFWDVGVDIIFSSCRSVWWIFLAPTQHFSFCFFLPWGSCLRIDLTSYICHRQREVQTNCLASRKVDPCPPPCGGLLAQFSLCRLFASLVWHYSQIPFSCLFRAYAFLGRWSTTFPFFGSPAVFGLVFFLLQGLAEPYPPG